MKNCSTSKKEIINLIGNLDDNTIKYLIHSFGDIPIIVNNPELIPANNPFFNKPKIDENHPLAKILTWLPRINFENKILNNTTKITSKEKIKDFSCFYFKPNKITYLNKDLNSENDNNFKKTRFKINENFSVIYSNNINFNSNNQYNLYKNNLENSLLGYNNINIKFNQSQNNINYSLEHKIRDKSSPYYIPSKKLYFKY